MAGAGGSIKQVLSAAEAAAKSGDTPRAMALYRQILTQMPRHSKAKKALARLERQGGGAPMTRADAQGLLQILNTGNFEAARRAAKHLSEQFPSEPFVFNILGYASGMVGDEKGAIAAYKWAIKLNPNFVEAMGNYGAFLMQRGKLREAVEILRKAITKKPDYAEAHHNLGLALSAQEDPEGALAHLTKAITLNPNYANAFNSRGNLHKTRGNPARARQDFQRAVALAPEDRGFVESLSAVLAELGDIEGALALVEKLLATSGKSEAGGDTSDLLRQKAVHLHALGRRDAARAAFAELLAASPGDGEALATLLRLAPAEDRDAARKGARDRAMAEDTPERDRVLLCFALAADAEKAGDTAATARWLSEGNGLYKAGLPPQPITDATRFAQARTMFAKGIPSQLQAAANPSNRPIFVLGLMRSGTSLVEQIIASHSQVHGAGELNAVSELGAPLMAAGQKARAEDVSAFAAEYLSVLDAVHPDAAHVVDKMPANFFHVGLLRAAFPDATIINTVRDPRDTCFSIWKTFFDTQAHQYAYDQAELAAFANDYRRLMDFWDDVLPGAVHHVRYEDLVADQETQSRKLFDHIGLPWEPGVLDFHENTRAVRTASVDQVRQRIYASSLGSWRPHADHLRALLDGLDADLWKDALQSDRDA